VTVERLKKIIIISLLVLFTIPEFLSAESIDNEPDWEKVPAAEIHQRLWESKSSAYSEKQLMQIMSQANPDIVTQTNYDVLYYNLFIRINDTTEIIYGKNSIVAQAAEDAVGEIQIDLYSNMSIDSIVALSGILTYTRLGNVVTVTLDNIYNTGEQFEFVFYYHGHPTEGGFQGFEFNSRGGYPLITTLSEPYFAKTWWPCKDRMDDKPDSMGITVEVDTALYCGSNGTLDSVISSGGNTDTYYYTVHYPITTYLVSLAINNYAVWYDEWVYNGGNDTMPLVHAVFPDQYSYSLTKYNVTPNVLTVLSNNFGQYPFATEKYGHSNFSWGGGMEHQTMTSMEGNGTFGFSEPVVIHECSHQWWGDMITCESWQDIWLNEGWASYAEAVYYLETQGWASYHSYMAGMDYTSGGTIYVQDTSGVWDIFTSRVYDKGAWVVHMLRGVLGESLFSTGVEAYYSSEFQHASATTEDFKNVFEAATGKELDWFFDEWIHGTYRPNYNWSFYSELSDTSGYDVYVSVKQTQTTAPQVFTMPIDLYCVGPNDTAVIWIDELEGVDKFNFSQNVTSISFDPSNWLMDYHTQVAWAMNIVTLKYELDTAFQYEDYADTIEAKGGSGDIFYQLHSGVLPTGFTVTYNTGVISGNTTDTGLFTFTVLAIDNINSYQDQQDYEMYVVYNPDPPLPGDYDDNKEVNVADLVGMVNYLFKSGSPAVKPNAADVNADCEIFVDDLIFMVNYLFKGGLAPVWGCVE